MEVLLETLLVLPTIDVLRLPNQIRPVQRPEVSNSIPVAALGQLVECLVRLLPRELLLLEE